MEIYRIMPEILWLPPSEISRMETSEISRMERDGNGNMEINVRTIRRSPDFAEQNRTKCTTFNFIEKIYNTTAHFISQILTNVFLRLSNVCISLIVYSV